MRQPSIEQQAVLDCASRVRIVRASPGSGKTWLVAEIIRQTLDSWPSKTKGIAALSFTRVGGDEIRKAIGHELSHPHYVGTIDAFLFRFVVRPFFQHCFPKYAAPRLIPSEWSPEHWRTEECNVKSYTNKKKEINLFSCVFIDEEAGKPVVAYKPNPFQPLRRLKDDELSDILSRKKLLWRQSGRLNHSDAAFFASKILSHQAYGPSIRNAIISRFPFLIVDELQDTGYYLGKSIRLLMNEPLLCGVLVGDPDQAIFEFNGAKPDLFKGFESLEDAVSLPLANSRRCPNNIVTVVRNLKDSCGEINPSSENNGRAILIKYKEMKRDINRIVTVVKRNQICANVKVIARNNKTIEDLICCRSKDALKLGCPSLSHMHRAVIAFRQGRHVKAKAAASAALNVALFKNEDVDKEQLIKSRIDPRIWMILSIRCLLKANALSETCNALDWQKAVGEILDAELNTLHLDSSLGYSAGNFKLRKLKHCDKPISNYLPQRNENDSQLANTPVLTVHGVKGETHDVTIFVCPEVNNESNCPSNTWWPTDPMDREERRIAYVAMTRTKGDLILCVSEKCFQRLATRRHQFITSLECMTVEEYESELIE